MIKQCERESNEEKGGAPQEKVHKETSDHMRLFISETARKMKDEKLLRLLYIRAKTLKNLRS